jgi:hypothetical protein
MNFFSKIIFFLFFLIIITNCRNPENKIPYVYVDILINLDNPEFFELNTIGNYVYITGGVSGIVIYRDSREIFLAYDRACSYDPECGRVFVDKDNFRLVDTICCGSKFSMILDGVVVEGPADHSLRKYNTYYYPSSNELRIVTPY